ncbi:MAG TPA: glycosyltransferase family 87 protein [Chloroflexota bacterium]|nr:glycosyltransferase family 87 protein [Chloroflexota bacterium]
MSTNVRVAAREERVAGLNRVKTRPNITVAALERTAPAQRYAVLVAVLVSLGTFVFLQVLHGIVPETGADFRAVLTAADSQAEGQDIYGPALHFLAQPNLRHILGMTNTPFVYPPPLAVLARPLTDIPPRLSLALWDALNLSMLAVLVVMIVRISRARAFRELVLISAIYGFFPLDMGLGNGQIDLTITLFCLASYVLYRRGNQTAAGVLLACITLIKPTVGIIVVYFLLRRAWPLLRAYVVTGLAGVAISLRAVPLAVAWEYRKVASGWANAFGVLPLNQSWHGQVSRFLAPALDRQPTGLGGILLLLSEGLFPLIAAVVAWRLLRRPEPGDLRAGLLQFYAILTVLLLGIPFTENMHLTWLLPGIAFLFVIMAQQPRWRPWHATAVTAYLVLALPFAEMITWSAGANWWGRLTSGVDCYGLTALSVVMCLVAFGPTPRTLQPTIRRRPNPEIQA